MDIPQFDLYLKTGQTVRIELEVDDAREYLQQIIDQGSVTVATGDNEYNCNLYYFPEVIGLRLIRDEDV